MLAQVIKRKILVRGVIDQPGEL